MKIGILTLPLHTNYGGILQAYALQTVLERMGHEVKVINLKQRFFLKWYIQILAIIKRIVYKYFLRKKQTVIFIEIEHKKQYLKYSRLVQNFINKYINLYNVKSYNYVRKEDFDLIIVGSDQIWRPMYNNKIEDAYLSFAQNWVIKRIAYAASFGTDKWEYTDMQTKKCNQLVMLFDNVSVREKSGVGLCKKYFGLQVAHVLDPTMLLRKEDYISLLNKEKCNENHKYIMKYILDETVEQRQIIDKITEGLGYEIKNFLSDFSVITKYDITLTKDAVESWLEGILYSDLVITDSFHACVFSIIFEKEFFIFLNPKRGNARILSLVEELGLTDRIICDEKHLKISENERINYSIVRKQLFQLRKKSMYYLSSSIN